MLPVRDPETKTMATNANAEASKPSRRTKALGQGDMPLETNLGKRAAPNNINGRCEPEEPPLEMHPAPLVAPHEEPGEPSSDPLSDDAQIANEENEGGGQHNGN
jgi:hypothetical protein